MTKKSMLIVDDNINLIGHMKDYFEDTYEVVLCDGPLEALKKANERKFDIIITDQKMPGMTGLEMCIHAIKNIEGVRDSVLVIMSAFAGEDGGGAIVVAKKEGLINGFICKETPLRSYKAQIDEAFSDFDRRRKEIEIERNHNDLINRYNDLKEKHETLIGLNSKSTKK